VEAVEKVEGQRQGDEADEQRQGERGGHDK
jgi:hypothetical protein